MVGEKAEGVGMCKTTGSEVSREKVSICSHHTRGCNYNHRITGQRQRDEKDKNKDARKDNQTCFARAGEVCQPPSEFWGDNDDDPVLTARLALAMAHVRGLAVKGQKERLWGLICALMAFTPV